MRLYTLIIGSADGHRHVSLTDFRNDTDAIDSVGTALTAEHRSIAIARGSGEELVFLGVWDLCDDGKAVWSADG